MKKHIAIAGNIGSGKSTLTRLLAQHYNYTPIHIDEEKNINPYIKQFYENMYAYSFHLQIYLLATRLSQQFKIDKERKSVIQDRTIYEDVYVFSSCLMQMGLFNELDYTTYTGLFESIKPKIIPPSLIIYLSSSLPNLIQQIQQRGRSYENALRTDYLKKLNLAYERWASEHTDSPIMRIVVDDHNFAHGDIGSITQDIDAFFQSGHI